MHHIRRRRCALVRDNRGIGALEYALLAAIIGGVVVSATVDFSGSVSAGYRSVGSTLAAAASGMSGAPPPPPPAAAPTAPSPPAGGGGDHDGD